MDSKENAPALGHGMSHRKMWLHLINTTGFEPIAIKIKTKGTN